MEVDDDRPQDHHDREQHEVAPELRHVGGRDDLERESQVPGAEEGRHGRDDIADEIDADGAAVALSDQAEAPLYGPGAPKGAPMRWFVVSVICSAEDQYEPLERCRWHV